MNSKIKTLKTAKKFRTAKSGVYIVTGEASVEMARQIVRQLKKKFKQSRKR